MNWMAKVFLAGAAALAMGILAQPAHAQELSEKAVKAYMDYAWSLTPARFTKPDGKIIEVDKKKKESVLVPVDVAREVLRVARISAQAQVCDLQEEQLLNYTSLMRRHVEKKTYTDQQMLFISQLHLTTVMLLTGKVQLVQKEEGEKAVIVEEGKPAYKACTEEDKKRVKDAIVTYVKAGPLGTAPKAEAAPAEKK